MEMATYSSRYVPMSNYNLPVVNNDWKPVMPTVQMPSYTSHVPQMPFVATQPNAVPMQSYPRVNGNVREYTLPQITQPFALNQPIANCETVPSCLPEFPLDKGVIQKVNVPADNTLTTKEITSTDYTEKHSKVNLGMQSELFPSATMFPIDPNPMIDEFCKQPDMVEHAPWIMDLELGIPRAPTTRLIPVYNVKFNSIQCKNTPNAIHPGFEMCNDGFKRVLLFYYDCIISTWYRGYVMMSNDMSVENFQEWLLRPMQLYGMCWPKHNSTLL